MLAVGNEDQDPVCLRDALWLAATMNAAEHTPADQPQIGAHTRRRRPRRPSGRPSAATEDRDAEHLAQPEGRAGPGAAKLFDDYRENSPGWTQGSPARRITLGGPGSLRGKLELARAMRPFRQSLPSRHRMKLDVEATIRATAVAGRTLAIMRPGAERRFSADLVLDVSPSMLPWNGAFAELVGVFAHVGAFREVRPWRLHVDGNDVSLADRFDRRWGPGTFRTTDRRRVVIIVTDAVAEHWYRPAIWRHIADWGSNGMVALIDLLPLKLWNFSGIGPHRVRVHATAAAAANAELFYSIPRRWRLTGRGAGGVMPLPVMELSPIALAQWSAMVAAAHPAGNAALLVESRPPGGAAQPPPRSPNGRASLMNFLHTASPEALRLAVLAATSDSTTLAVLRAIQQELLPESAVSDLAEVLVSGIFQRLPDSNGPDLRIRMNADCRAGLQALASPQDRWDVYRAVSAVIQRASPESAGSFQAAVHDLRGNITIREDQQAFAEIARSALAQAADSVADLAPHLPADLETRVGAFPGARWRVFVSHTSELRDFPAGRSYVAAVERAISAAGHVVVDMADFPATDQIPAEVCRARVRGCQVYVGVLGTRYGSPVRDMPDVSYTELEFDTSAEAGLDRLMFVLDTSAENVGIPASALIDDEFGARQEAFRRRVQGSGLVTQSFADPATLGQLVERSLRQLAGSRGSSGTQHGQAPAAAVEETRQEPLEVDVWGGKGVQVGEGNTQIIYTYNRLTWTDGVAPPPLVSVSGVIDSPYRGLGAFEEQDAAFFFGRERDATELLERMSRQLQGAGLLVVSGVSGAGKSSLLRAGVLPRIRGAGLASAPESARWPCLVFTPGRSPLDELALRVAVLAGADAAAVRRGLDVDPAGFALTARQAALARSLEPGSAPDGPATGRHQPQLRLLLVVDQFEQVFTQCADQGERQAFITALHAAASAGYGPDGAPAALIVLGVRADFEARCAEYPQLASAVQNRYLVTAMTEVQLRMAITEPAKAAGSRVNDELVDVLLTDARIRQSGAASAGVLPLLSYALDQAWRSRAGDALTLADYERTGGIEGAVANSAQRAYDRLTPRQQAAARQVFIRLAAATSDGADTAGRVPWAELTEGKNAAGVQDVETVLEVFAAERLLTLAADSVEISHEVLLTAWPLLRDTWLTEPDSPSPTAQRRLRWWRRSR